jgi:hypothetical protein
MKASISKLAKTPQTSVFQTAIHKLDANPKAATPKPKSQKQDKLFSKSRVTRKDHGPHQMDATLDSQKLFRLCAHSNL